MAMPFPSFSTHNRPAAAGPGPTGWLPGKLPLVNDRREVGTEGTRSIAKDRFRFRRRRMGADCLRVERPRAVIGGIKLRDLKQPVASCLANH